MELANLLSEYIKQSIDFSKFTDIIYGEVVQEDPLQIKINELITLEDYNLVLTNSVKDYYVDVTVNWNTEDVNISGVDNHSHIGDGGWGSTGKVPPSTDINSKHKHPIKGRKKILIHNALKQGEKVIMVKMQGGQLYVVLDRIVDHTVEGEWEE